MCIAIAQAASLALLASAAAAPRPLTSEQTVGTSNQQATSRSRVFGNGTAIVPTLPPSSDTERGTAGPAASAAPPPAPFQLMVNYQRAPALGVGPLLRFSWAVAPPVGISTSGMEEEDGAQETYQINVVDAASGSVAWNSGVVRSNASINIEVDARQIGLQPGRAYDWTVCTDGGAPSSPTRLITALWDGFVPNARWIWASNVSASQHFANFRYVVPQLLFSVTNGARTAPELKTALLYVTAWQEPTMLSAYKIYIDGELVSLGPGRGEADVLGQNSTFLHAPYNTVDVTKLIRPASVIAIEGMAPLFSTPCNLHACSDTNTAGGGVLAQVVFGFEDGTSKTVATGQQGWSALPADAYYNPSKPSVSIPQLTGETAYAKLLEFTNAAVEVVGWRTLSTVSPPWPDAVESTYQAWDVLVPRMGRPLTVYTPPTPTVTRNASSARPSSLVDFGCDFQGGLVLTVDDADPGTVVQFITGELLLLNGSTDATTFSRIDPSNTWGYGFNWTLRSGPQTIIQHNYMLFRYASVVVVEGSLPKGMKVSAWGVKYEYVDEESHFISSNATLNAVHELARWTVDGGVLDTYTDSNTRERRPYECDGLIAATARGLLQNDPMWGRHSHSWVLEVPTWPVEWMQMAALLAWLDFTSTGSTDFFSTYQSRLYTRTNVGAIDGSGLVNTSTGRHLVGWDPAPTSEMFANNAHTSVCNGWTIHGLEALAAMAAAAGDSSNASAYATQASSLRAAMLAAMWDASAQRFCDGPCTDPRVNHHGGVTTNYFTLYFGLVPEASQPHVWREVVSAGLEAIGDYGAFIFANALASVAVDDGSALVNTLTKCDAASWCNEMATYNATMTTESLGVPHQTMSHPWGTAAIPAIVHGVMGVKQTAPAWETFTVKPQLGSLTWANITVPTIRGPIVVAATRQTLRVAVPCTSRATLCVWAGQSAMTTLALDGNPVAVRADNGFLCADDVRCRHAPRVLVAV